MGGRGPVLRFASSTWPAIFSGVTEDVVRKWQRRGVAVKSGSKKAIVPAHAIVEIAMVLRSVTASGVPLSANFARPVALKVIRRLKLEHLVARGHFANGCLFKVPETRKGKAEADAFIEEPADAAEVDGEEPSDLLAEEPECAVPENVQEPDEQELLRALMEEQLVATAKAAEQAPAASSSSGTAAQPTDKKRATYRRLAAAGLLRKPLAKGLL